MLKNILFVDIKKKRKCKRIVMSTKSVKQNRQANSTQRSKPRMETGSRLSTVLGWKQKSSK